MSFLITWGLCMALSGAMAAALGPQVLFGFIIGVAASLGAPVAALGAAMAASAMVKSRDYRGHR
jgi:hypothetical protein